MPEARAQTVLVDSKSNIYLSGSTSVPPASITHPNGAGALPPSVTLVPGTGRVLRFLSVSGSVSYNNTDAPPPYLGQFNGPDGGAVWFADSNFPNNFLTTSGTPGLIAPWEMGPNPSRPAPFTAPSTTFYVDMDSFGGISGMQLFESTPSDRRVMYLAGVFLTDNAPTAPAPASLDFSSTALGTSFSELSPLLQQTFYIGDGLTGEGTGSVQTFWVPDGATRLFLGIVDGAFFGDVPGDHRARDRPHLAGERDLPGRGIARALGTTPGRMIAERKREHSQSCSARAVLPPVAASF
ncbi:MAG: hypothetical protein NTY17_11565 [Planctomycetia bacterium]|nr:hypothetical protein [Planctomycetia bacterium]